MRTPSMHLESRKGEILLARIASIVGQPIAAFYEQPGKSPHGLRVVEMVEAFLNLDTYDQRQSVLNYALSLKSTKI